MREVVPTEAFQDEIHVLIPDARVADEYLFGVVTVLSNNPEIGMPIHKGSIVWAIPMAPIKGEQVVIYYEFDATTVFLLSIRPFRK